MKMQSFLIVLVVLVLALAGCSNAYPTDAATKAELETVRLNLEADLRLLREESSRLRTLSVQLPGLKSTASTVQAREQYPLFFASGDCTGDAYLQPVAGAIGPQGLRAGKVIRATNVGQVDGDAATYLMVPAGSTIIGSVSVGSRLTGAGTCQPFASAVAGVALVPNDELTSGVPSGGFVDELCGVPAGYPPFGVPSTADFIEISTCAGGYFVEIPIGAIDLLVAAVDPEPDPE